MENKRWSLILMALCLALVFSVSSVEAQQSCDRDNDGWLKDTRNCGKLLLAEPGVWLGIDCDDNDDSPIVSEPPCDGGGPGCPTPNVRVGWANMEAVSEPDQNRLCVPAMISYITALSPANNGLIIAVYSFNMFIGASLGPQLVVGLRSLGFFATCLVFAAVLVAMGVVVRATPERS